MPGKGSTTGLAGRTIIVSGSFWKAGNLNWQLGQVPSDFGQTIVLQFGQVVGPLTFWVRPGAVASEAGAATLSGGGIGVDATWAASSDQPEDLASISVGEAAGSPA
jgi:hypothetical protein